ncbi:MAG: hypothetical protein GY710_18165 [Desulfobacteraceae bacterium]|nr:hypothetical protein [Desulfobacteraceae bacterium]
MKYKWKLNYNTTKCNLCESLFTSYRRKHHCRVCGNIVCDSCSSYRIPGVQNLKDTPWYKKHGRGSSVRVCELCAKDSKILYIDDSSKIKSKLRPHSHALIDYAKKIIIEFNSLFPISSSKQKTQNAYTQLHQSSNARKKHMEETHYLLRKFHPKFQKDLSYIQFIEKKMQHCVHISIANCHELSRFVFLYMYYYNMHNKNFDAGLCICTKEDHVFNILRASKSTMTKKVIETKSYRGSAIVLDVWKKNIFFLRDYARYYPNDQLRLCAVISGCRDMKSDYKTSQDLLESCRWSC